MDWTTFGAAWAYEGHRLSAPGGEICVEEVLNLQAAEYNCAVRPGVDPEASCMHNPISCETDRRKE
jgi:hypothetical protein